MVVTTGSGAQSAYEGGALNDLGRSQDELDYMGEKLAKTMAELHALQDEFEKAVMKQAKKLNGVKLSTSIKKRKTEEQIMETEVVSESSSVGNSSKVHEAPGKENSVLNGPTEISAKRPPLPNRNGRRGQHNRAGNASQQSRENSAKSNITGDQYVTQIDLLSDRLRKNEQLMPATGGIFVELFLGTINVRFARKSERLSFKHEYEKLKMKLAPIFVVTCIACLFYKDYRWLHMMLQLALSCYYVTLAVRENILRRNGSNIRSWWIIHHYFTMMQGVVLLTWPSGESYTRYRQILHLFGLYNAVLMIFQTRYQMARLYTLRSLGMANEMDVASSDSPQIHWSETMIILLPLIVFGQLMQAFQAVFLFFIYQDYPTELQILLLCLLFAANFAGNSITTVQVLQAKRGDRKRKSEQFSQDEEDKKTS